MANPVINPQTQETMFGQFVRWGTAIPTSTDAISFFVGDIIINSSPAAGKAFGWQCVTAGNPGTWQSIDGTVDTVTKTAAYTATINDDVILADTTTAGFTVTLPAATANKGKQFTIKNIAASNTATVATAAGNIDGSATYTALSSQYKYVTVVSNGTQYYVIANN